MSVAYFYSPWTCSLAGMVCLEMAGAQYRAHEIDLAGDRQDLRAVSDAGKVPVLVADGEIVTDTIAIAAWVHRVFPAANILPTADGEYVQALSFMAWCGSTLHILRRRFARPMMFALDAEARNDVSRSAASPYRDGLARIDAWLASAPRCWGVIGYALVFYEWALLDGQPFAQLARLRELFEQSVAVPAARRALIVHRCPGVPAPAGSLQTATGG